VLQGPDCVYQGDCCVKLRKGREGATLVAMNKLQRPGSQGKAGGDNSFKDLGDSL